MRKWDDVTSDDLLSILTYLAQNFDPELTLKVIELFHERMRDDLYFDPEILHLLMKRVFALIMDGKSADQAFGLKPMKGRHQRPDTTFRDIRATAIVILQQRRGENWENAVMEAAERLNVSERTIQRAYANVREALECVKEEVLKELADP